MVTKITLSNKDVAGRPKFDPSRVLPKLDPSNNNSEFEPSRLIPTDLTRQYSFLGLTRQDLSGARYANFIFVFSLAAVRQRGVCLTAVRHGGGSSTAVRQGPRVPSTDIFALK